MSILYLLFLWEIICMEVMICYSLETCDGVIEVSFASVRFRVARDRIGMQVTIACNQHPESVHHSLDHIASASCFGKCSCLYHHKISLLSIWFEYRLKEKSAGNESWKKNIHYFYDHHCYLLLLPVFFVIPNWNRLIKWSPLFQPKMNENIPMVKFNQRKTFSLWDSLSCFRLWYDLP